MRARRLGAVLVAVAALAGCAAVDEDAAPVADTTRADGADGPASPPPPEPVPTTTVAPAPPPGREVVVVSVTDGDTIDVRLGDGRVEAVRLIGINTPEQGECLAGAATRRLSALLAGESVRLERDRSERDDYGRLLRHVVAGGRWVNEVLVAEGLAVSRAYPPDTTRQPALDRAQRRARDAALGQWAPDACGPAAAASVAVGATRTDPPGDESLDLNQEWIEVRNTGGRAVDLTGWGVRDESATNRFEFPPDFRLAAGATVRIRSGCGRDTATDLHWCSRGSAVWNNDGDTVFVTDPRGNVVASRSV